MRKTPQKKTPKKTARKVRSRAPSLNEPDPKYDGRIPWWARRMLVGTAASTLLLRAAGDKLLHTVQTEAAILRSVRNAVSEALAVAQPTGWLASPTGVITAARVKAPSRPRSQLRYPTGVQVELVYQSQGYTGPRVCASLSTYILDDARGSFAYMLPPLELLDLREAARWLARHLADAGAAYLKRGSR